MRLEHAVYLVPDLNNETYRALEQALERVSGVQAIGMDTGRGLIEVPYDPNHVTPVEIVAAISSAGFRATPQPPEAWL